MSEFKGSTPSGEIGTKRATAQFPGLSIEIIHRRLPSRDAEELSINLRAVPSFEAFGRFLEAANPFAFWAEATRLALLPWLVCAGAVMPGSVAQLPKARAPEWQSSG